MKTLVFMCIAISLMLVRGIVRGHADPGINLEADFLPELLEHQAIQKEIRRDKKDEELRSRQRQMEREMREYRDKFEKEFQKEQAQGKWHPRGKCK